MSYITAPGMIYQSKDYTVMDTPLIIGCLALQESGEIVEVKSIAHIEVLTDMGAKMIRLKQLALDTVGKQVKKSFRPMIDKGAAFEKFKRQAIFNK